MIHFCVFFSPAFESRAKVCIESLRRHHPASITYGIPVVAPEKPGEYIEGFHKARFKWMRDKLSTLPPQDRLIFVGADCVFYARAIDYLKLVEESNVTIIPHVTELPMARGDQLYKTGHANGDLVAFAPAALPVLDWLLKQDMVADSERGIFYEQTWLSALPFIADRIGIYRDTDMNVAWFNLDERPIKVEMGAPHINGQPLVMFHYTGFIQGSPARISKYYAGPEATGPLLELLQDYDQAIRS